MKLSLGGSIHEPTDPVGRLLFNVLAMVAEFEADLIQLRSREGRKLAKAKGWLRGKQPKLNQALRLRLSAGYWFAGSIPAHSQHRTCAIGSHLRVSLAVSHTRTFRRNRTVERAETMEIRGQRSTEASSTSPQPWTCTRT